MDETRIKLAEAMGWTKAKPYRDGIYGLPPGARAGDDALWLEFCLNIPNPETDANDDYAVLEWMQNDENKLAADHWGEFQNEMNFGVWEYRVGDIARAACKVLGIPLYVEDQGNG